MKTYIVDSFTSKPFRGNPAGVCFTEKELPSDLMLSIAAELGLSETAFIQKQSAKDRYSIRYFSPKMEIPLCGHATLASAKVVFEESGLEEVHFLNIQNIDLYVQKAGHEIVMEFPVYETSAAEVPQSLLQALGLSEVVNCEYNQETNILLLEIADDQILKNLQPDFDALLRSHDSIHGVLVSASSSDTAYDFLSRFFWPWSGTNEDPVTGGTHTFLAKYWSSRLKKTKMKSFQASKRTGFMEVELIADSKVLIRSEAVIVLEGRLRLSV